MKKLNVGLILVLGIPQFSSTAFAQAPPIKWQRCYGGSGSDSINSINLTRDSGYIACGTTTSTDGDLAGNGGVTGIWALNLDAAGNILWEKTYFNGSNGNYIEQTADGGFIMAGSSVLKLDSNGDVVWIDNIEATKIHQTSDGGYILCYSNTPILTKLKADGSTDWSFSYAGFLGYGGVTVNDVCTTYDTGYVVTGTAAEGFFSVYVALTNDAGVANSTMFDNGMAVAAGRGIELCKTFNGKYLFLYYLYPSYVFSELDDTLGYNGINYLDDVYGANSSVIVAIAPVADNGALIGEDTDNIYNIIIKLYDSIGRLSWTKNLGGSGMDYTKAVLQGPQNSYVMAGNTTSEDGDVSGNHGGVDGWIVNLGYDTNTAPIAKTTTTVSVYPIPANDQLFVSLPNNMTTSTIKMVDVTGRTVMISGSDMGQMRTFEIGNLAAGAYLLQIIGNGYCINKKVTHY